MSIKLLSQMFLNKNVDNFVLILFLLINFTGYSVFATEVLIPKTSKYLPEKIEEGARIQDIDILRLVVISESNPPPLFTKTAYKKLKPLSRDRVTNFLGNNLDIISYAGIVIPIISGLVVGKAGVDDFTKCDPPSGVLIKGQKFADYDSLITYINCNVSSNNTQDWYSYGAIITAVLSGVAGQGLFSYFNNKNQQSKNNVQDGIASIHEVYLRMAKAYLRVYKQKTALIANELLKQNTHEDTITFLVQQTNEQKDMILFNSPASEHLPITFVQLQQVLNTINALDFMFNNFNSKLLTVLEPLREVQRLFSNPEAYQEFVTLAATDYERIIAHFHVDKFLDNEHLMSR